MRKEDIYALIPIGHDHAISRASLAAACGMSDREMRRAIEILRRTYCICNDSDGKGYYVPRLEEYDRVVRYDRQEKARDRSRRKSAAGRRAWLREAEKAHDGQMSLEGVVMHAEQNP